MTSNDHGILDESSSGYTYYATNGNIETYNTSGQLQSVARKDGLTQTYNYNGSGQLTSVTGPFGRTLTITYSSAGLISTITDPAGGQYTYSYDASGNLTSVEDPDGRYTYYQYSDASYPHALTKILNNDGSMRSSWSYDSQGRAYQNVMDGGLRTLTVTYNSDGSVDLTQTPGNTQHITFMHPGGVIKFSTASNPCAGCYASAASATYDSYGNLSTTTDFNGVKTSYDYNPLGYLDSETKASGTNDAYTITQVWLPLLHKLQSVTDGVQKQGFSYNSLGQLTQKVVKDVASGATRKTTYTYGANELLASVTGPRTDVTQTTSYTYNSSGDMATVTNALGHETQFTAYDANGNPTTIVDPNGVTTTLTYDPMQRVTAVDRGGATTRFAYDANGWLSKLTLPDGATYTYGYDAAGWVSSITDAAGNKITYTRNGFGKITQRQIVSATGTVTETQSRTYNSLEQLATLVGSAGQTSSYGYDANGNMTSYTNPDNKTWGYAYDVLNRLSTITRPDGKSVGYTYNSRGDVTQITDPRGLSTDYTYNGFDDLTQVVSPNTATTSYAYDAAGDLTSRTDANGTTTTYTYDKLDRLTQVAYSSTLAPGGGTASFGYDQGTDGVGHLTTYANASETSTLGYNALGQVVSQSNTLDGRALKVAYTYDLSGNLTSVTYPDGMKVSYTRDATGRVSGISVTIGGTTQTLASNVTWQPFGPLASLDFANGLTFTNGYTQDGWLSSITLASTSSTSSTPLVSKALIYDDAGNLTGITNNVSSSDSELFSYDGLNQLTFANGAYGAITYGYDGDGNRTSKANTAGTATYAYPATNNKVQSISGPGAASYSYDADGNVTADGTHTYTYAETGRLVGVDSDISYSYNALGNRVEKQVTSGGQTTNTLFVYDQAGHLIGQYSGSGAMEQEIVWLRNRPIAVVTTSGVYYIQTDQRNAPRTITDSAGAVVWQWNPTPFGENAPMSSSGFLFNLRYPGQYYDAETGNVYNHARYYDPALGRYLESDPMGLSAGVNTYAYVTNDPEDQIDPTGFAPVIVMTPEGPVVMPGSPIVPQQNIFTVSPANNEALALAMQSSAESAWSNFTDFVKWIAAHNLLQFAQANDALNMAGNIMCHAGNQDKKLTPGDIKKLKDAHINPEALKGGKHTGRLDLYKDPKGNIIIKPKGGSGPGEPTGININDLPPVNSGG